MDRVLTIIMAGGEGTRLSVLANRRAKPAVPFCGIYRIIDFTLSNVMHSGGRYVGVITQYRPYSLADHIGTGEWWGFTGFGRKGKVLSPHTGDKDSSFYVNTADAVYRNIEFIERFPDVTDILILSGDHIYQMDYRPMIELHRERGAMLTIATQEVPWEETSRFGVMVTDDSGRIVKFQEKPKVNPLSNKASLGIYVFSRAGLIEALRADQADPDSKHDFGHNIIPKLIGVAPVYNYIFKGFWRDVGTIQSYVETSMEALRPGETGLDLSAWDVRTNHQEIHLHTQHPMVVTSGGAAVNSLISRGSHIRGEVSDSILSPGVRVGARSRVRRSILLHEVTIEDDCELEDVIIDKHGVVRRGSRIGVTPGGLGGGEDAVNREFPHLLNLGTTVIGKGAVIEPGVTLGRNSLVFPGVTVPTSGEPVPAGTTFFKAGR